MKILFVTNLYGDNGRGGAERIVEQEARAMLAAGHDVTVLRAERGPSVSSGKSGAGEPRLLGMVAPNLYFYADDHKYKTITRLLWHVLDTFNFRSAVTFKKILEREKPDVVHTHNLMGLGFLLPSIIQSTAYARKRRGEPRLQHVHTVHDVQLLHPSGLLSPTKGGAEHEDFPFAKTMQWAYEGIMRRLMGSPDVTVFPSEFLASLHASKGYFPHSKRVVLTNPSPAPVTSPRTPPSPPAFLFVGQIEVHKGVFLLIEAWVKAGLHRTHGATLTMVGDGVKAERLRSRIEGVGGVTMTGKLQGEALTAQYDRASFLVVPSLIIENQPTVILEAFSRGTPVVGAVSGGIPELVHENVTGFLFSHADVEACAEALKRAVARSAGDEWQRLSKAGLDWSRAHGSEAHMSALKDIYEGK